MSPESTRRFSCCKKQELWIGACERCREAEKARDDSTIARAWAAIRVAQLSPRSDENADALLALGGYNRYRKKFQEHSGGIPSRFINGVLTKSVSPNGLNYRVCRHAEGNMVRK